jgi:hypothetical protein
MLVHIFSIIKNLEIPMPSENCPEFSRRWPAIAVEGLGEACFAKTRDRSWCNHDVLTGGVHVQCEYVHPSLERVRRPQHRRLNRTRRILGPDAIVRCKKKVVPVPMEPKKTKKCEMGLHYQKNHMADLEVQKASGWTSA